MGSGSALTSILVHYQELALKGRNRPWFIERFVRNLRDVCSGPGVIEVRALMGRVEIVLRPDADVSALLDRVRRVFGVANFSVAARVAPDIDAIAVAVMAQLVGLPAARFRVRATRADKGFPLSSPEIERTLGGRIHTELGWPVDLSDPDRIVYVEIVPGAAFCSVGRQRGAGGLPTGASGRVACLLSGGIDSPVAAWRLMKRGCRAMFVHFHSYPIVSSASQEKVRRIVAALTECQIQSRLLLVPFGDLQRRLVVETPPALRVVLYRRFMLRIADRLAWEAGVRVLVTGEAVGQVASQTLENIAMIDGVAKAMVLRPLIGMDKEEITAEARRVGTYDISILPDEDCCQLFTPRHPATRARVDEVEAAEAGLPITELVDAAVAGTVREDYVLGRGAGVERIDAAAATATTTPPSEPRLRR
jgi:thiamine biosynthesis protein ThiI